ncbi:MAG: HTH-type transcriptional regulator Ptr1 [Candidatus Methanogaster sp.]|nr:MAG: HTH-type transcriptional regulator Ptr1 [ANME-2 cluster archaeon]
MEDHRNHEIKCWKKESCEGLLETLAVDDIDLDIIKILSENARMSNVDIANKISVSEGTVRRRIAEMAKNKVIEGFVLLLNCEEAEKCVKAFVSIEIADSNLQSVADKLLKDHEHIIALYRTSTRFNLLSEVMFRSIIELQEFIDGCHKIEGIVDLDVKMVIGSYKKCLWTGI